MNLVFRCTILIIIFAFILSPSVFADANQEEEKARIAVENDYTNQGYTVGDGIPTLHVEFTERPLKISEMNKIKSFKQAADYAKSFNFELYDETGQVWGSVFAYQNDKGEYQAGNTIVNTNSMIYGLSNYEYDEIVIISDVSDYYICIKNGDEEFAVPGVLYRGKDAITSNITSCTIPEFFNALYYRETYDPYDSGLLGSRGSKPVFNYVGLAERKQFTTVIVIVSSVVLVGGVVVLTIILLKRRKD